LRNFDTKVSWSEKGYHGWGYDYALHLTVNRLGLPRMMTVQTGSTAEGGVLDRKLPTLLGFNLQALVGDNGYFRPAHTALFQATQSHPGYARCGLESRPVCSSLSSLHQTDPAALWLKVRRTAIDPVFDLVRHLLGTKDNHKKLLAQGLAKVRTFLALGALAAQVAMITNLVCSLPYRQITHFISVFK
jgi:hypothetical protein